MVQVLASIIALLPTSVCIGATIPLAIRIYARDQVEAVTGSARAYFWNLGTASALARSIGDSAAGDDQAEIAAGVSNLMRCYGLLREARLFHSVPSQRYRDVLAIVESTFSESQSQPAAF